jgi:hypothetical protein
MEETSRAAGHQPAASLPAHRQGLLALTVRSPAVTPQLEPVGIDTLLPQWEPSRGPDHGPEPGADRGCRAFRDASAAVCACRWR